MTLVKTLLDAKRSGAELASDDIRHLIAGYVAGEVPDYQMAAFAMAVCWRGMTPTELFALTDSMRLSGANLDWGFLDCPTADKHSTGGVGDKLSFVIQPLITSCGVAVPSLTGRGLGHTGGTTDKLESIPGYNAELSLTDFRQVVSECGCSLTSQTAEIAPADRRLYALRDVTGTVASIPLIVASILSKKLAEGAQTLVFDVKCGRGAFMRTFTEASTLAHALVDGAHAAGRKAAALVTAMDEPLGYAVGNAVEIEEALSVLAGEDVPVVRELSIELAALAVSLAKDMQIVEAKQLVAEKLKDGSALAVFERMVKAQGGDLTAFRMRKIDVERQFVDPVQKGVVAGIDAMKIAEAALILGAGRAKAGDLIDSEAGVILKVRRGCQVNGTIAELRACGENVKKIDEASQLVREAIVFDKSSKFASETVLERIE